jgi:putative redox protein
VPESRTVHAQWGGDYRCRVTTGAFTLDVDEPVSVGGSDTGPQPTELFLASVASCFTLALSYAAAKRSKTLDSLSVDVTGVYDGPKFSHIRISADIGCDESDVETLLRAAERVCYVTNTLRSGPVIEITATAKT